MSCDCSSGPSTLIYACSGAANTGLFSGQVARSLAREGFGKLTCLDGEFSQGFVKKG